MSFERVIRRIKKKNNILKIPKKFRNRSKASIGGGDL